MAWLRRSAALGAVLLAATSPGADSGAPLEASRQELRKLESSQKASNGPDATDGLRPRMPTIQTPGQEALPSVPLTSPEKLERERQKQKEAQKNWLVNGVEQLQKSDKSNDSVTKTDAEKAALDENGKAADGADPQSLLELYDEQKKLEETRAPATKPLQAPRADPLAPFLQGWLGNSPVRGQFFDEFVRKPDGTVPAPGSAGTPVAVGSPNRDLSNPGGPPNASAPDAKPNPYLTEPSLAGRGEPAGGALSAPVMSNPAPTGPAFDQPIIPRVEAPAEVRQAERKPLLAPFADDKKYFPQLKKF